MASTQRFSPLKTFHGTLELSGDRLRFTVDGEGVAPEDAAWLAAEAGDPGGAERVVSGEPLLLFDVDRRAANAKFPLLGLGITMLVTTPTRKWVIYFVRPASARAGPSAGGAYYLGTAARGRRASRAFRRALRRS